jgi:hypothetical protein
MPVAKPRSRRARGSLAAEGANDSAAGRLHHGVPVNSTAGLAAIPSPPTSNRRRRWIMAPANWVCVLKPGQ